MKKKLLFISGNYFGQITGGAEYQSYLLSRELLKRGYDIYYLFIDNGQEIKNDIGIKLIPIRKKEVLRKIVGNYFVIDYPKVIREIRKVRPDVIYNRTGFAYTGIAASYCKHNPCKMIWHVAHRNDLIPTTFKCKRTFPFEFLDKKFLEYGIENSDCIIAQAKYQEDLLVRNYGTKCDRIVPSFHPVFEDKVRKRLPVKIVWIANIKEWKQPELFIGLAKELSYLPNVKFIMIGRQTNLLFQEEINKRIAELSNLEYWGEKPFEDVNEILCDSHLFVNTSKYEGFPNTFIQAWMREVPVVSLHVDPDDVLKKNKIGYHSGSFEQMVKDVEKLIHDGQLRKDMGKRAQKYACQNHSLSNIEKIVELIENWTVSHKPCQNSIYS